MRRKTFDTLLTFGGLVLTIVLVVAGSLLLWGHNFAQSNVQSQLAQQAITFPTAAQLAKPDGHEITTAMQKTLGQYAGKPLTTGAEAKAYANDFIAVHLSGMPYHGVYSTVSSAASAASTASKADPTNTTLAAEATTLSTEKTTVFQGTTLRGLLLEAYGFSEFGTIAFVASIASFILAGIMALLAGLGFWHLRKVDPTEEFLAQALHLPASEPVTV